MQPLSATIRVCTAAVLMHHGEIFCVHAHSRHYEARGMLRSEKQPKWAYGTTFISINTKH